MNNIENLQDIIDYHFKNQSFLDKALTHISWANELGVEDYDRLEFLGDAVLELVVSNYIFNILKDLKSGDLTKLRASLVSTENLYKISQNLGLDSMIKKSKALSQISKKTTADLFESLMGAVYLDGGYDAVKNVIEKFVIIGKDNVMSHLDIMEDAKTRLQEMCQAEHKTFEYRLVSSTGLDHEKVFEVELIIDSRVVTRAFGKSKHLAEEKCAKSYIDSFEYEK